MPKPNKCVENQEVISDCSFMANFWRRRQSQTIAAHKVLREKIVIKNALHLEVALNLKYIGARVVVVRIPLNRIDRKLTHVSVKDENDVFWDPNINKHISSFRRK